MKTFETTDKRTKIQVEVKNEVIWIHHFSDGEFKPVVIFSEDIYSARGGGEKNESYES